MTKPALCLAAPLLCCLPGDKLSRHVAVTDLGTPWTQLRGVCVLCSQARGGLGCTAVPGGEQQDSQWQAMFGSRGLRRRAGSAIRADKRDRGWVSLSEGGMMPVRLG